jgi:plastocyanin
MTGRDSIRYYILFVLTGVVISGLMLSIASCTGAQESIGVRAEWQLNMEGLAFNRNVIAVPAGEQVVLTLKNTDTYTHDFSVYATEKAEKVILEGIEVPAHTTKEYRFTAPSEPGRYHFRNDFYAHKMKGTFIVSTEEQVELGN